MARHRKDKPKRPRRQWKSVEIAEGREDHGAFLTGLAAVLNALNSTSLPRLYPSLKTSPSPHCGRFFVPHPG